MTAEPSKQWETIDWAARLRYSRPERRRAMNKSLLTLALTAVAAFSVPASAQATFETLMTHSISTAVGTHAGTALGRATNALAGNVANRTSAVTRTNVAPQRTAGARAVAGRTVPGTKSQTAAASAGSGSLIASIQGGERTNSAPACAEKTSAAGAQAANCATQPTDEHPSIVNLPAPK